MILLGFVKDNREHADKCTWQNSDAFCYRSLNKDEFSKAAIGKKGSDSTGIFNNEPAGDVQFVQVECTPHFDLDHGEIFVMQLPWRPLDEARAVGRRQIEWCRNWQEVMDTGREDCPGSGLYIHKYIEDFYDDNKLRIDGGIMERVEFNFNAGQVLSESAFDFLNNHESRLQNDLDFRVGDLWTQLNINFSALQGVNFNADLWMPSGNFQLSEGDDAIGAAWTYSNFDWNDYNGLAYNQLKAYAVQTFADFGTTIE